MLCSAQDSPAPGLSNLYLAPDINFTPQQRHIGESFAPRPEKKAPEDLDSDVPVQESSLDPLDFLSQAEAEQNVCVTEVLLGLAEHEQYYSLEDALQYAFEANREKQLPSEPN